MKENTKNIINELSVITTETAKNAVKTATKKERVKSYLAIINDKIERISAVYNSDKDLYITSDNTEIASENIVVNNVNKVTTSNDFDYNVYNESDYEIHATKIYDNQLANNINDFYELLQVCNRQVSNSTHFGKINRKNVCKATYIYIGHNSFINYYKRDKVIELVFSPIDIQLLNNSDCKDLLTNCIRKDERKLFTYVNDKKDIVDLRYLMKSAIPTTKKELKAILKTITCKVEKSNLDALHELENK